VKRNNKKTNKGAKFNLIKYIISCYFISKNYITIILTIIIYKIIINLFFFFENKFSLFFLVNFFFNIIDKFSTKGNSFLLFEFILIDSTII
jgi:hypothetical protein